MLKLSVGVTALELHRLYDQRRCDWSSCDGSQSFYASAPPIDEIWKYYAFRLSICLYMQCVCAYRLYGGIL